MALLDVAVLGPPDVRHGQHCLSFPTRKTLALLLYLVVEGGSHSREKLTALFWPESNEVAGRSSLRTTLARLREGLAETADERHLIVDRHLTGFDFASDFNLDLVALQSAYGVARSLAGNDRPSGEPRQRLTAQFQQAAEAWRGEFLEGFSLRDAPDFDEWASLQREMWRKRMEVVLDRLSLLYANAGSTDSAIETADRWLRLNPLEERAYRRLMRLHFAFGDRAAALRIYDVCRELLETELGVLPDPETSALAERVRAAPRADRHSHRHHVALLAPSLLDRPLVGREDEFTNLVEHFYAASQGRTLAVVLQGEAGIGKTRLATEFLDWAVAEGADVLHGRAFEMAARLPYQPLIDALRPRWERQTGSAALLSPVWLSELSRLLPELRDRYPDLPIPEGDEAAARTRLFEAFARLGRALATRAPLVLFIDDVQWADVASLDMLHYAARRWAQDGTRVLLCFCLRSEALVTNPASDDWLRTLGRDFTFARLDLEPLSYENTRELLQGLGPAPALDLGDEAFARWIFEETRGQPFYIIETLRALFERGALVSPDSANPPWVMNNGSMHEEGAPYAVLPPSVRQIIQSRLAPLPQAARELLASAAVLGQGFTFERLCGVSHLAEAEALAALDVVLRGNLLHETGTTDARTKGGQFIFAHDKIRDVVYSEAGEARRSIFHRRALATLEAAGAPAAELARHALAGGLEEPALHFSIAAGDEAMQLLAARVAANHYERAMTLAQRLDQPALAAELRARRGHAFVSMAMWPEARHELEAALAGFGAGQQNRYAEILTDIAEACWWLLDIPAVRHYATEALALADRLGRGDVETRAMAWLAAADGSAGNLASCLEQNQRAIQRSRALGIAPPGMAGHYYPITLYWLGRLEEATQASREAVAVAWEANDISWVVSSLPHLGIALAGSSHYTEAMEVFNEARRLGREYQLDTLLARSIAMSAGFHLDTFNYARAEHLAQEARELARSVGFAPPAVSAGIDLLLTYARQHEPDRVGTLLEEVTSAAQQTSGFHGWLWSLRLAEARAELALARDEPEEAIRWAGEAVAQSQARGRVKYQVAGLTTRARALVTLGRTKSAIEDLRAAVTLVRPIGDAALFLRTAAELLAVDGDDALAAEARTAIDRIAGNLPDPEMRRQFELAEPTRLASKRA